MRKKPSKWLDRGLFFVGYSRVDSPRYCAEQAVKACPGKFDVISRQSS